MNAFDKLKDAALAATRELMMAVEFAEQAREAIEGGAFQPASDSEIESAESALITVRAQVLEMEDYLAEMRAQATIAAQTEAREQKAKAGKGTEVAA